jgi:hypothetical protein
VINLKKSSILTRGGGLSLLKGSGTLLERAVRTPLSNRWATKSLISSGDRAASYIQDMSDLNKDVVNNTKNRQRDNLSKGHGRDRPFTDIRTPVSSSDRGGESAEDRILRHSGTPRAA